MMAARKVNNSEILSNVHNAMRLLTSAIEALSVNSFHEEQTTLLSSAGAPDKSIPLNWNTPPYVVRQRTGSPPVAVQNAQVAPARYVVFDFETSGIGKTTNVRVCQIGATALAEDFTVIDHFAHFCNPLVKMDQGAQNVHGFNTEFVSKFDSWEVVGGNFMRWLDLQRNASQDHQLTLMAHNGKRFDARILVSENARHGIGMPRNLYHCDSIDVMKILFPGRNSYSLGRIYEDVIGNPLADAHDAMADVNGVIQVLKCGHLGELTDAISLKQESFNHIIKRALRVT